MKVNTPFYADHRYLISCKCQEWGSGTSSLIGANDPCHTSCNQPNTAKESIYIYKHKIKLSKNVLHDFAFGL